MVTSDNPLDSLGYAGGMIRRLYGEIFRDRSRDLKHVQSKFILLMSIADEGSERAQLVRAYETGVVAMHRGRSIAEMFAVINAFDETMDSLLADGYAEEENGRVCLTQKGTAAATTAREKMARVVEGMSSGLHASVVSIVVNVVIAAVSLAAGLLSNSMGLISSGVDNTVSIGTSAAAYAGIRYRKETAANAAIVLVTLVLGVFLGYESVGRLLSPEPVDSGLMPVAVAIFTGIACYLLSIYQRFHGRRSGKFSLIILAVDNLNSVLVSAAVLVGIAFARFGFPFVDSLVSLGIALLMLKSAVDLGRETLRIADGEEPDLSQYELGIEKRMTAVRECRTRFWIMYLLREPRTGAELDEIFSVKRVGGLWPITEKLQREVPVSRHFADCLCELTDSGLAVRAEDCYRLTAEGARTLADAMAGQYRMGPHDHDHSR